MIQIRLRPRARVSNVVIEDENGKRLQPWAVRAGMLIIATDYRHSDRTVVCRVQDTGTNLTRQPGDRGTSSNPRTYPCSHQLYYGCPVCDPSPERKDPPPG